MKTKLPSYIERELKDALVSAKLTNARFSADKRKDAEVKEAIKLYMDSWIVARLETILRWNDGTIGTFELHNLKRRYQF